MKGNKRRRKNAKMARQVAEKLFPNEMRTRVIDGIFLSPRRPVGKNSNYKDEIVTLQKKWEKVACSLGI